MINILDVIGSDTQLKKVGNVSGRGPEYAGPCPFCASGGRDRFRVQPDQNQWWCRQCSPNEHWQSPADYLMKRDNVSFVEAAKELGMTNEQSRSEPDTWNYHDADGVVVYRVVRYVKDGQKSYYQQHPDGDEWKRGLNGTQPTIYRLPAILQAAQAGKTIYIAEGEKCVDALLWLGLDATTNSGGAGKWRDAFSQYLEGASDVVIFQDNDEPGKKHADTVLQSVKPIVPSARIVTFDDVPSKGDVADWLKLHTKEELLERCVKPATIADTSRLTPSERVIAHLTNWGYTFRLNRAGDVLECNGVALTNDLAALIRTQYRDAGLKNIGALEDAYRAHAWKNAYHPVHEYLNSLVWDGEPHIARLTTKLHSSDPRIVYSTEVSRTTPEVYLFRWLIGTVAKALDAHQHVMLVLGGPQGIGKSAFVKWLCSGLPAYFLEAPINPGDKDNDVRLITKWIWEVGELDATTRKADVAALKAFITKGDVTVRKAYDRLDTRTPALASFIGTFNPSAGFLSDTQNRRFWITTLTKIDWSYRDLDVNQVWAEAMHHYRSGKPHELLPTEVVHRDTINDQHQVESILESWIEKYFVISGDPSDRLTAADIVDHLRDKDIRLNGSERALAMELSRVLEHLKVVKVRTSTWRGYAGIRIL